MASDAELRVHRDWIGALQPIGLVVSAPALVAAQAFPDPHTLEKRAALLALVEPRRPGETDKEHARRKPLPVRFPSLAEAVLGWTPGTLVAPPEELSVVLPAFHETLRPTYAVRAPVTMGPQAAPNPGALRAPAADEGEWMMLVEELPEGAVLDTAPEETGKRWRASPQVRMERLLRETGVPIGILTNGLALRLVYAPRAESSGHLTWPLPLLTQPSHKEGLAALCMLLGAERLFTLGREQRLPHILAESRKYQNVVSTKLAGQVLEALNELLRGFQAANEKARGRLLDEAIRERSDHVYGGLLAVLLRLVLVLYAEERGMLPSSAVYVRSYSLVGLFEKLRIDQGRFPDTMDDRYGAWSRLLVLFRMIYDGARHGDLRLPRRHGHLFDPEEWGFLEGRPHGSCRVKGAPVDVPKVADGVVYRVLEKLLVLDGERLSYRALDVEQIGSVYENMMGFRLERATEVSIGVGKDHVVVGLETLLAHEGPARAQYLKDVAGIDVSGRARDALESAGDLDDVVAALTVKRISPLTPRPIPAGGLFLQPTDERRRSGSHYTPRALTEPVVRATLRPILDDLGPAPRAEQVLALKVCDPAMGSGAFLVEACRQLADALVASYDVHGRPADVPHDEDIVLYARRKVAQRCLYGVDKNDWAVDLGRLSLWLMTLAHAHAFTFLDHSLRHGDSLVGLSREQTASFHWDTSTRPSAIRAYVESAIVRAEDLRARIQSSSQSDDDDAKRDLLRAADAAVDDVRLIGDCVVACFFSADTDQVREQALVEWQGRVESWLAGGPGKDEVSDFVARTLREGPAEIPCFHWEIEFPEVFPSPARKDPVARGFQAMVGNPPWVSYAGRAAQPLAPGRRAHYLAFYRAFAGYRNLQGLFVERVVESLSPGGRLGLVLPSSMAELDGYGPSRAAHDRLAVCDGELPDLGEDSFRGVFQPSMVLRATARAAPLVAGSEEPWPIERPDVDAEALRLLAKFGKALLPADLFGERGLQTTGSDTEHLRGVADAEHTVPLRVGGDVQAFRRASPSLFADPRWFGARLRPSSAWSKVAVLIRQTARVPIAALSDGLGFRNSILAGFASDAYPAPFLTAYLNSTPIRWRHYYRNRDARLGMPQVKIGHLRMIPAPPADAVRVLDAMGRDLAARNDGIGDGEQRRVDETVAAALSFTPSELARMLRDAEKWR